MDPQLANLNLDPPRQTSLMRRGLLPAVLVNAVFFAAIALSLNWPGGDAARNTDGDMATRTDTPADTRSMGAAPAMAPPPASGNAAQERSQSQPQVQPQPQPRPQLQSQPQPMTQAVPPAAPPMGTNVPATTNVPASAPAPARTQPAARSEPPRKREAADTSGVVMREATGVAVQPSFDCAKARSWAERTICKDPELAQLDRDTGRLHARAKAAARDPAAFRRENDREWKQRETECRTRACLVAWYAHRREQLQESVAQAR